MLQLQYRTYNQKQRLQLERTGFSSQNRKPAAICNLAENLDSKKTPYLEKLRMPIDPVESIMKINKMDQESPDYIYKWGQGPSITGKRRQ